MVANKTVSALRANHRMGQTLILSLLCLTRLSSRIHVYWKFFLIHSIWVVLAVLAWVTHCNQTDLVYCLLRSYVDQLCLLFSVISRKKDVRKVQRESVILRNTVLFVCMHLWSLLLATLTFISLYRYVYGGNETSYGGNFNLRYLSPGIRSSMRPFLPQIESAPQIVGDGGLRFSAPISAYIPGAGFLWTDEKIWSEQDGSFVTSRLESGQNRVILNDKINRMCKVFGASLLL